MTKHKGIQYRLCESVAAITWHIRKLGPKGPCFGGGADTPSLCGRKMAWDIDVDFALFLHVDHICKQCAKAYAERRGA